MSKPIWTVVETEEDGTRKMKLKYAVAVPAYSEKQAYDTYMFMYNPSVVKENTLVTRGTPEDNLDAFVIRIKSYLDVKDIPKTVAKAILLRYMSMTGIEKEKTVEVLANLI